MFRSRKEALHLPRRFSHALTPKSSSRGRRSDGLLFLPAEERARHQSVEARGRGPSRNGAFSDGLSAGPQELIEVTRRRDSSVDCPERSRQNLICCAPPKGHGVVWQAQDDTRHDRFSLPSDSITEHTAPSSAAARAATAPIVHSQRTVAVRAARRDHPGQCGFTPSKRRPSSRGGRSASERRAPRSAGTARRGRTAGATGARGFCDASCRILRARHDSLSTEAIRR